MTDRHPPPDAPAHFADAATAARYADGPPRFVPGFDALHRMTAVLLSENTPDDAHVLVLGAGGGLELAALARARPGWRFTGVDPSGAMLAAAAQRLGPLMDRVTLVEGTIDAAPPGPFDAATCLLTLHFLAEPLRRATLSALHARLRPGAPFVAAHLSIPADGRALWLARYAAYAVESGVDPDKAAQTPAAIAAALTVLDPDADARHLREAGFATADLFYAALAFRGWIATA